MQRIGIPMSEFDARVNRVQEAYEGFKVLLSMCPNHEDIVGELPPNERLDTGKINGNVLKSLNCLSQKSLADEHYSP